MLDRRTDVVRRQQFERARRDLVQRLQRVCGHWPPDELHALTARMIRLRVKYDPFTGMPELNRP